MAEFSELEIPDAPKLAYNVVYFARALRKAGLPVGPGRTVEAIRAVQTVGFTRRSDFYWTLHACFVNRPEHRQIFHQVFRLFWRDPRYLEHMMAMLVPAVRGVQEESPAEAAAKRAAQALLDGMDDFMPPEEDEGETRIDIDASQTISSEERLKTLDFEQMSAAEMERTKRMLARLRLPVQPIQSRRTQSAVDGRLPDWRRTMRDASRRGGDITSLGKRKRRIRWPNLVVLCDISGSMSQYSRVVLHFLHAVSNAKGQGWARVHAFTFGTQLTNITRHLHQRDVDAALKAAGAEAQDWEGGTRIGGCLHSFNRDWSRRVLGQGAVVLLISDGLDRGDPVALSKEVQRLQLSSRRLIWLNPLLRWDGFAAKAQGVRAMLPYVDSFRAGHSVASLEDLAQVISRADDVGEKARLMAAMCDV